MMEENCIYEKKKVNSFMSITIILEAVKPLLCRQAGYRSNDKEKKGYACRSACKVAFYYLCFFVA